MSGQLYGIIGVILSVIGSIVVARLSSKAQDKKAQTDADVTSGQLALQIAERADKKMEVVTSRLNTLEHHVHAVARWWSRHEPRDREVEKHLNALDPTLSSALPPYEPMPELNTPAHGMPRVE